MPVITMSNLGHRRIEIPSDKPILTAVQEAGVDWMHSCGGKGRCTTCRFLVLQQEGALSPMTPPENTYRATQRLEPTARLACQTRLLEGEILVRIPEDCQLPHLSYTD